MTDVELVPLPIPRPLLPAVTALINDYYNGTADPAIEPTGPARPAESVEVTDNGRWDRRRVHALLDGWHNAPGRQLLAAVAQRTLDGHPTTTWGELKAATGQGGTTARSNLGALSKHAIKVVGKREWPMHCANLGNAVPNDDRYVYSMPVEVAEWVLEALA